MEGDYVEKFSICYEIFFSSLGYGIIDLSIYMFHLMNCQVKKLNKVSNLIKQVLDHIAVVKWDQEIQSILNVWFVWPFSILSGRLSGTSPFKTIGDLHAWASSSIKSKPLTEGTANF